MAKFRNVSGVDRIVGYGFPSTRKVLADDVLTVPTEVASSYGCQPTIWSPVDQSAEKSTSAATASDVDHDDQAGSSTEDEITAPPKRTRTHKGETS
jgi:hypothetical protein